MENIAALKIQRCYRAFTQAIKENDHRKAFFIYSRQKLITEKNRLKPGPPPKPKSDKPKIIVDLPPPWTPQQRKKLSPTQVEEKLSEQKENVKWMNQFIMPQFTKRVFFHIDQREKLRQKNEMFRNRRVPRTFFSMVYRTFEPTGNTIINLFVHESTFRIFVIHQDGITIQYVNQKYDEFEYHPYTEKIIDSEMDKLSGRVFCLLSTWQITVFENGFFAPPCKLGCPAAMMPQQKYIHCDKYGHLWVVLTQKYGSAFLLDPLCFTVLKQVEFNLPRASGKVKMAIPLFAKDTVTGFLATSCGSSDMYLVNSKGSVHETFSNHRRFAPNMEVINTNVFTYGNDKNLVVYKRRGTELRVLRQIPCASRPVGITYIKGFQILIVALADCTIRFYTLGNEAYQLTMPTSSIPPELIDYVNEVIGAPKVTKTYNQCNMVYMLRVASKPVKIRAVQFAQNCCLVAIALENDCVASLWLNRRTKKVQCATYDAIGFVPTMLSQTLVAREKCQLEYDVIFQSVLRTRAQLQRDAGFLMHAGAEIEKRYISSLFNKRNSVDCADVILQSPYRRWCRFLRYAGSSVTIYELFWFIRKFQVVGPSLGSPEKLNTFLIDSFPSLKATPTGPYMTTLGTLFTKDTLSLCLDIIKAVFGTQLTEFESLKNAILSLDLTIPSIQMKTIIRDYNDKALHRLNEIENLVKNKMRRAAAKQSTKEFFGKIPRRLTKIPIPEISAETATPILVQKLLKPSSFVMPDPLVEAFRYRPMREVGVKHTEILYRKYSDECPAAKVMPNKIPLCLDELHLMRPLAKQGLAMDMLAISPDGERILSQYPLKHIPLSYVLEKNPFKSGNQRHFHIARLWLSQILVILAALHKQDVVLRSCMPSNWLLTFDGNKVLLQSMADAYFGEEVPGTLPYDNQQSPWLPPEHFAGKDPTSCFDIYQFGVLLLLMMTDITPPSYGDVIAKHKRYRADNGDPTMSRKFFFDPLEGFSFENVPFLLLKGEELRVKYEIDSPVSLYDVIIKCLDVDPNRRPTAKELLRSPFFCLNQQIRSRSENLTYSLLRKSPISVFVDAVFGTLCQTIEEEMKIDPINTTSLETAVDVVNYFINKDASGVSISFPIEETSFDEITDEIFKQGMFDKIVMFVINRLHVRFEYELDVESDVPFSKLIRLYDRFMRVSISSPVVAKRMVSSFPYLATGVKIGSDCHRMFCFLHKHVRPMVELFLQAAREYVFSRFYCEHYLQFYDNSRDFAGAFHERSERRHAAAINFFSTFVDNYPNESTMKLLIDFRVDHKIEQSLCFSFASGRLAAIRLCSKIIHLKSFDSTFFHGFVFTNFSNLLVSDQQPYEEKLEMLELIRDIMLSRSMEAIFGLLSAGILDAILYCTTPRADRGRTTIWGQNEKLPICEASKDILTDICQKGPTNVFASVFSDNDLITSCIRLGVITEPSKKAFHRMVERLKTEMVVDQSLITTLAVAEHASVSTITAITLQSQQSFEASLMDIANFIIASGENRFDHYGLFRSVLSIWQTQQWSFSDALFESFADGLRKGYRGHMHLMMTTLQILQRKNLPRLFRSYPIAWFGQISKEYAYIKSLISKQEANTEFMENYRLRRSHRIGFLSALLKHPDKFIMTDFEVRCNFPAFLVNTLLKDSSKMDINSKVVPSSFSRFNRTYLLKSEGILLLREILNNRGQCTSFFFDIVNTFKGTDLLDHEARILKGKMDKEYRRTVTRMFNVLNTEKDVLEINERIAQSEALRILKAEALNDWEEFQLVRGTWDRMTVSEKVPIFEKTKHLYDI